MRRPGRAAFFALGALAGGLLMVHERGMAAEVERAVDDLREEKERLRRRSTKFAEMSLRFVRADLARRAADGSPQPEEVTKLYTNMLGMGELGTYDEEISAALGLHNAMVLDSFFGRV